MAGNRNCWMVFRRGPSDLLRDASTNVDSGDGSERERAAAGSWWSCPRRGLDPQRSSHSVGALGRIRTSDTRFRKPMLYPLSYEGSLEA